jgi:hypothetical protein
MRLLVLFLNIKLLSSGCGGAPHSGAVPAILKKNHGILPVFPENPLRTGPAAHNSI